MDAGGPMDRRTPWSGRPDLWAGALILGTTLARLAFAASGQLDLVQDEAQYWDWSRTFQFSYFTKGPLIAWIIGLWTWLLGDSALAVRLGAVLGSALMQVTVYLGLSRLFGRPRLGLLCLLVLNTTLLFLAAGTLMTTDNPLMVCWWVALFALYAAGRDPGARWPFVALAAALAVGTWGKYMMLAFAVTAVLHGVLLRRRLLDSPLFWRRLALALAVGAGLGLAPILLWNLGNDFAGFKHVAHLGGLAGSRAQSFIRFDRFAEYYGSQFGLLMPWWFVMTLVGAWGALRSLGSGRSRAARAVSSLDYSQRALLVAGFWPVWGFFALWCFHTKVHPNWSAVSYASGFILAAVVWERILLARGWRHWKVWTWPAVGALVFVLWLGHDLVPMPYRVELANPFTGRTAVLENPALHLKGWEDLGREVDRLRRTRFADPGRVFLFGNHYDVTAELGWVVPGRERAYCVNVGRRLNQYDLWPGPEGKMGWDAIYVRQKFKGGVEPGVEELFDKTVQIHYQSMHRGRPARQFTIALCYGFKGKWPRPASSGY